MRKLFGECEFFDVILYPIWWRRSVCEGEGLQKAWASRTLLSQRTSGQLSADERTTLSGWADNSQRTGGELGARNANAASLATKETAKK